MVEEILILILTQIRQFELKLGTAKQKEWARVDYIRFVSAP